MTTDQISGDTVVAPNLSNRLMAIAGRGTPGRLKRVAIIWPAQPDVWDVIERTRQIGLAQVTVVGGSAAPEATLECKRIRVTDKAEAVREALRLAAAGQVDAVMNGSCAPGDLIATLSNPDGGLLLDRMMTGVSVVDVERFGRLVLIADPCVVRRPGLEDKVEIVRNAVAVARSLWIEIPRVAVLSATEMVNPKSPTSQAAAQLSKMAQRGQLAGCLVDGPLALDNAISSESARIKRIDSEVAGRADVLIAPDIETADVLVRAVTHLTPTVTATVVVGGKIPIALPSRSDTPESKLASLALALWLVDA